MQRILTVFLLLFVVTVYGQEAVAPLYGNPSLYTSADRSLLKDHSSSTFDSTFIYNSDTLDLPFFDEFSKNNFQQYNYAFNDANVTSEMNYTLLQELTNTPLAADIKLSNIKSYKITVNEILGIQDTLFYDSIVFQIDDLASYPVIYETNYGFPNYFIYDTIDGTTNLADTVFTEVDFHQDSARIFIAEINEPSKFWLDSYAYHNYRYAVNPISLGVVTFDGLDEFGYPYNFNQNSPALADVLTSKPLNMGDVQISDTVYFSFLFQRKGLGDAPEETDSLFLEFYSPVDQLWTKVWRTGGGDLNEFEHVHLPVVDPKYFENGFQFRFQNYGSVLGALDHFHIDYVNLRPLSNYLDTNFKDFAIVYPINTLLNDYTQVPWDHFRNNPTGKMNPEMILSVRNNETVSANNSNGGSLKILLDGVEETTFNFNGASISSPDLDYAPRTHYFNTQDLTGAYEFDATLNNDTMAVFDWIGEVSAQFPNYSQNDSTFGQQLFQAVYAYDDGTAEKSYGTTSSQSRLAYKFDAYEADSLVAVQIHFVPSVRDASNDLFLLTVWNDNNGEPGDILYQDDFFNPRQPQFQNYVNGFQTYYFNGIDKVAVPETFYVGWRQIDEELMHIGLDMNIANNDKIFYSVDGESTWNNSSFEGSLLMRPMFSTKLDYQLGVEENVEESRVSIYPNPSEGIFNIKYKDEVNVDAFDLNGRLIQTTSENRIDLTSVISGMYILRISDLNGNLISTQKVIKK